MYSYFCTQERSKEGAAALQHPFSVFLGKAALPLLEIWERIQVRGRIGRDGCVRLHPNKSIPVLRDFPCKRIKISCEGEKTLF